MRLDIMVEQEKALCESDEECEEGDSVEGPDNMDNAKGVVDEQESNFFAYTNLIGCLDEDQCKDLYHHFEFRTVPKHEVLFHEGAAQHDHPPSTTLQFNVLTLAIQGN